MVTAHEAQAAATLARHVRRAHRIRLEIPDLLGDAQLARAIEESARTRPGVTRVTASARSGRVLIEYAPDAPVAAQLTAFARAPRVVVPPAAPSVAWHAETADATCIRLGTDAATGLTVAEAAHRLAQVGPNVLETERAPSRIALFVSQLANLPTAMLLGSTLVSMLLGDVLEASTIVTVVLLNAGIGYRVERYTQDLLAAWRTAEVGKCDVVRGGSIRSVPASQLVPGDVIVVRAGMVLGADARVVDAHRLATDEAPLTGESDAVAKTSEPVGGDAPLGERASMVYAGTAIASGHGLAVVVATGAQTEIATIQQLAAESRAPKGRMQGRLNALASRLAWSGLAAAAASAAASLLHRRPPLEILRDSVALGVAAIPEGLPVTATAALVRAMARLRARGIVVRRLGTAETLGAITVACTDKTGTLTENRMRLEVISILDDHRPRRLDPAQLQMPGVGPLAALVMALVLNSDLQYQRNGHGRLELAGSSTERALVELAQQIGADPEQLHERWPRRRLVERREGVHYVISEHEPDLRFMKGAPEQVVPLCDLDAQARRAVLGENDALAGEGRRVLAVAWQRTGVAAWTYLGLVALRDPLRAGSIDAVREAARAGIRTVLLTGDQRATAAAIARQAGVPGDVIEGRELAALLARPDADERLHRVGVIARVTPADKVRVVQALRKQGEVVAMIGDGINDAPALRASDVGIAVGLRSTDLARQTADVVLERPDLRAVLAAVNEGRGVQDSLRRSIRFQAAGNLGEILLAFSAAVVGRRLIPSMGLLWINLLTDTLPGLALALEPSGEDLLTRAPLPPEAPILDRDDWRRIARDGALVAATSGIAAILGGPLAAFAAIGATQFGYAALCRAPDRPATTRFAAMIGGSAALHLLAIASAPLRGLLRVAGPVPPALASFAVGLGVPLYLAWRREAGAVIVRTPKELP
jgi:Ca2+-transporting ATPase